MVASTQHMLSTIDNPFNPFTDWDEWFAFDERSGYHTTSFLARIAKVSEEMAQSVIDMEIEAAIEEIVTENVLGIYIKVPKPTS